MPRNGNRDSRGAMVRIDDSDTEEDPSHVVEKGNSYEEEEEDVYIIEYSNPEEEGESYKFKMRVDRSDSGKKPTFKPLPIKETSKEPGSLGSQRETDEMSPRVKMEANKESDRSSLEPGGNRELMETDSGGGKKLMCPKCPVSERIFKKQGGLARHVRLMHSSEKRKTYFCTSCNQTVRTQIELDAHTRRHAKQEAVFTCSLCSGDNGEGSRFKGSRLDLKKHLEREHQGVIPHCNICKKRFKTLGKFLDDQFRHVGVSPHYCDRCQIYEMTERGLIIHMKNHDKKKKKKSGENQP